MEGGSSRRLVHERHHLLHDLQGVHGPGAVARLIVVPIAIFFLDIMSNLLATHRIALADEHGADAEVAQPHRPARGDEGEKRRGHRRLAGGRADQAQHPVAPRASGGQRWVWLTRSSGGRGVCLKQPPRPRERAEGLARSSTGERCLPSPDGLWRPRSISLSEATRAEIGAMNAIVDLDWSDILSLQSRERKSAILGYWVPLALYVEAR